MSYKSEFQNLWKKTIDQIKVDIDQNAKAGKINAKLIKNNYIVNAKKWETSVYREGEWLESIGNDDFSRAFIQELNDIEFKADIPEPAKNYIGIVVAAVGVATIFVLALAFSVSWIISVIVGLAVAAAGVYLQGLLNKRNIEKYNKEIKKSFIKIVINKGKNLEDLIDKYYS